MEPVSRQTADQGDDRNSFEHYSHITSGLMDRLTVRCGYRFEKIRGSSDLAIHAFAPFAVF
jgi:hypothetical protein